MSEARSNTPRLSDVSSVDSPRTSLDNTPTGMTVNNPQGKNDAASNAFISLAGPNGGMVFDETKFRRSSPESDAVTSSDEELEQNKHTLFPQNKNSNVSQMSSRRPSYAAEFHTRQRTYSITGGGPLSPTTSHPTTPSGDTAAWAAGVATNPSVANRNNQSLTASLWAGSIWNTEPSKKSPPKPLDVQVPPNVIPANHSPLFAGSEALPSPTSLPANNGDFPIPIPLQPQFRNYRSMSFSVGQMDLEDQSRQRLSPPAMVNSSRQHPGLQHRPSRPSLLSEEPYAGASTPLRSVFETEDDEEGPKNSRERAVQQSSSNYLQQQQANLLRSKYESMRLRNRSASAATIPTTTLNATNGGLGSANYTGRDGERIEEYESALAEDEDLDIAQFQAEQRRFSEAPRSMSLMYSPAENQRLANLRRQHWTSTYGIEDAGTQSRRHSFAGGLPAMNDQADFDLGFGTGDMLNRRNVSPGDSGMGALGSRDTLYLNDENRLRARQSLSAPKPARLGPDQHHLQTYSSVRVAQQPSPPPGPHRSMIGVSGHHVQQPRSQQLLFFVTFKACRGDVFYVQEGTGLRVRVGDLVIVEADRGTDLGTVVAENITWQKAKELKENYAKEQYNVLMMYASRRSTGPGIPGSAAPGSLHSNASGATASFANGTSGAALSGHGPAQNQDSATAELKPKMIKRLAQPHEIQTLRDKEANEAKAKRVCQQKVLEHRLPMEILDAEFQMDWKKLTFYYFADSYINFNSLVTDLFKVYKTRIWMSAMNPASFAHPTTGLHPPGSGIAPSSTLGVIGETPNDPLQVQYTGLGQPYPNYASTGSSASIMNSGQRQQAGPQHMPMASFPSRHSPHSSMTPQDFGVLSQQQNSYNSAYINGAPGLGSQVPFTNGEGHNANGASELWMGLQGLSLNSH